MNKKIFNITTYQCNKCGMAVNANFAKCETQLVNNSLTIGDGQSVQVYKCIKEHGKIKSPL